MIYKIVETKNLVRLKAAMGSLQDRSTGVPGMGLLYGKTGAGKTTALASVVARTNAVYIRATAAVSLCSLLDDICLALGPEPKSGKVIDKFRLVCSSLHEQQRPIFIDEADYLVRDPRMLDILRDIHDVEQTPVFLVGMTGIEGKLIERAQLARRFLQKVEFTPLDMEDTRLVADELCEVHIEEDLLKLMHTKTNGCIGRMVVALAGFERLAKGARRESLGRKEWGNREMFLGSERTGA